MHFACPNCQKRLALPDQWAGKETVCPYCRRSVAVPDIVVAEGIEPAKVRRMTLSEVLIVLLLAAIGLIGIPWLFFRFFG